MRIAVVNYTSRRIGGVETYLEAVLPLLQRRGHALGFWAETDVPSTRPLISLPANTQFWSAGRSKKELDASIGKLKAWQPDVIYLQKLDQPAVEARLQGIAPILFFVHDYHGTCISGKKSFAFPTATPCHRCFGPGCLVNYFPRRCGGLSPITMLSLYRKQSRRLKLLRSYETVIVASEHMAREYRQHGVAAEVIVHTHKSQQSLEPAPAKAAPEDMVKLAFLGRFEGLKGGMLLIKALTQIADALGKNVECHFAGQGTEEKRWKAAAKRVMKRNPSVKVVFHGWLSAAQCTDLLTNIHLMVLPSTWPEPFGGVGFLAGDLKVPAVAFDVGGISHWLHDGVNGVLAPGNPPTVSGLANAVIRAAADPVFYKSLCEGAYNSSNLASMDAHMDSLEYWLERTTHAHISHMEKSALHSVRSS